MLIDCDTCRARGVGCGDCVISVLLDQQPQVDLDGSEQSAVGVLAARGLVPPLRLVPTRSPTRRGTPRTENTA